MEKKILIPLHYLPSTSYFTHVNQADTIIIEANENFQKQTYRSRCYINTANKIDTLSVPTKKSKSRLFKDTQIDYTEPWVKKHWKSILSAYGKAPFFEYFIDSFETIYSQKEKYLFDLNMALLTNCLTLLQLDKTLNYSEFYEKQPKSTIIDLRARLNTKTTDKHNISFAPHPYNQIFGKEFVGNLSIIDLLFCEGPNALSVIRQSIAKY